MKEYSFANAGIMVIDDSAWMSAVLRQMLKSIGFTRIDTVSNPTNALTLLESSAPDILLTDWDMPGMDGLELTRRVRRLAGDVRFLPIVMVSAYGTLGCVTAARNAGVTEFLVKPVSPHSLYRHLVAVIERPRLFIEAPGFVGPDRRRSTGTNTTPHRRRASDIVSMDPETRLDQDQITALMSGHSLMRQVAQ